MSQRRIASKLRRTTSMFSCDIASDIAAVFRDRLKAAVRIVFGTPVFSSVMPMRKAFLTAAAVALLLSTPGCGDDSDPEADAVSDTYVAYIDAVKAGDGKKACALTTPAFQRRAGRSIAVGKRAFLHDASCEEVISKGTLPAIQQVEPNLEEIEVSGDRASGLDPGEGVIGPQEVHLVRLGGDWKISRTVFFRTAPSN